MAFIAEGFGGTVLQASLSFTGAASGPVLGLFLLGGLFPWANAWGAIIGGLLGLIFPLWISIGAYSLPAGPNLLPFPTNSCVVLNETSLTTTTTDVTAMTSTTTPAASPEELSGINLLYTVSYLWYPSIGAATVVVVGLVVSFITGPMSLDEVDPKYLIPLFDRLFCCLPASWRKTLRCKKEFQEPEDIEPDSPDVFNTDVTHQSPALEHDVTADVTSPDYSNGKLSVTSEDSGWGGDVIDANGDAWRAKNGEGGGSVWTTQL